MSETDAETVEAALCSIAALSGARNDVRSKDLGIADWDAGIQVTAQAGPRFGG